MATTHLEEVNGDMLHGFVSHSLPKVVNWKARMQGLADLALVDHCLQVVPPGWPVIKPPSRGVGFYEATMRLVEHFLIVIFLLLKGNNSCCCCKNDVVGSICYSSMCQEDQDIFSSSLEMESLFLREQEFSEKTRISY